MRLKIPTKTLQRQYLDPAELGGVGFGLDGDEALAQGDWRAGVEQALGVGVVFVELGAGVFEYGFTADAVADQLVAADFDFERDPLVAVVGA